MESSDDWAEAYGFQAGVAPVQNQVTERRLPGHGEVERGEKVVLVVDGRELDAYLGETVAGALMAVGVRTFRETFRRRLPRGLYCGMGVCYDCLVVVDGRPNTRACMTYVADGMKIELQKGWGET